MDAQWSDDLHHCIHSFLTEENQGYYVDYGSLDQVVEVFKTGTYFQGQYSKFRQRRHGRPYRREDRSRLVVALQNHDQVGNRARGERLSTLLTEERLKAAAAWTFLFGGLPLIFMGEEIGETSPFAYFVDHSDKNLVAAVQEGRKKEFSSFTWQGEVLDPAAESTFNGSRPDWSRLHSARGKEFFRLYQELIKVSKTLRRRHVWEDPAINIRLMNDKSVLHVVLRKSFEFFASFSGASLEILRALPQLPPLFVSEGCSFSEDKIELKPFAVAVFHE